MVRTCEVCGERVLVSKGGYTESRGPQTVSPLGIIGAPWVAHNGCIDRERRHEQWNRLVDACDGNEKIALAVVRLLP